MFDIYKNIILVYYLGKRMMEILITSSNFQMGGDKMAKRIKDTPIPLNEFRNEFFNVYRKAIEFYFGNPKEEAVYVEDTKLENELMRLILDQESKIIYFLGKGGIGKTTLLKNIFNLSDNAVTFDESKDTVYMSMSFRGQLLESDIRLFLINSVSGLCTALEERYGFRTFFYSVSGHNEFYDYVKETKRALLEYVTSVELIGKSEQEVKLLRLQRGEEKDPYTYIASKLKFYLCNYCSSINNFTVVIDNIETLPQNVRFAVVRNILSFFSCMLNAPKNSDKKVIVSNLLLSMRQSTYEKLNENEEINVYSPSTVLYKENPVDMLKYFEMKKAMIADINGVEKIWEDAYEIIMNLANKFNGKYSTMIKNLSNYDFQIMKKCYKKILTNKVWLLRGERRRDFLNMSKTDHLFNNISVVRAISCGNNAVYRGIKSIVLPNVLRNDEFHDDSMVGLLVLSFLVGKNKIVKKSRLYDAFSQIFNNDLEIQESLRRIVEHYLDTDILEETYYGQEAIKKKKYLLITPRGSEIWSMFVSDSVLLEMYREDYYFSNQDKQYGLYSSYSLMETVGQHEIFTQLFHYISILIISEKRLHKMAKDNNKLSEYYSCFGTKIQSKRLLEGVIKSIEYSGNMYFSEIQDAIEQLEQNIKNVDMDDIADTPSGKA